MFSKIKFLILENRLWLSLPQTSCPQPPITPIKIMQRTIVEIHGIRPVIVRRSTKNKFFFDFASGATLVTTRTLAIVFYG